MKKLGLLAIPLVLAACSGVPTGSTFSADAGGAANDITYSAYYKVNDAGERVYTGGYYYTLTNQPEIYFTNHAGSVGVSFTTATVTLYDQAGKVINLGKTMDGTQVNNPYTVSFMARLIPGWACPNPTSKLPDPQIDPNSCTPDSRVGYERLVKYPAEGNTVTSPTPISTSKTAGVITYNIASTLATLAYTNGSIFNGYMIIDFQGTDDNRKSVSLKSGPIPLNVHKVSDTPLQ